MVIVITRFRTIRDFRVVEDHPYDRREGAEEVSQSPGPVLIVQASLLPSHRLLSTVLAQRAHIKVQPVLWPR